MDSSLRYKAGGKEEEWEKKQGEKGISVHPMPEPRVNEGTRDDSGQKKEEKIMQKARASLSLSLSPSLFSLSTFQHSLLLKMPR